VARLLAKALNCERGVPDDPCGECDTCRAIAAGSYLDVLEIDAASNTGVDNIRDLRDMAQYTPTQGRNRIFIIDEVHMLSKGAFNALLKILEEPPARVFFFFATTEANKIPRTILSRCQRFDFRLLSRAELNARLESIAAAEGIAIEPAALRLVVSLAEGSMRDSLSVLDQLIAAADGKIDEKLVVDCFGIVPGELFLDLNETILTHDPKAALAIADRLIAAGHSLDDFAQGIVANFRNLLLVKLDAQLGESLDLPPEHVARLAAQAERFSAPDLLALLERSSEQFERIHRSTQPRILLEAALVEYALFESRVVLTDLVRRLEALGGAPTDGGGAGRAAGGGAGRGAPNAGTSGGTTGSGAGGSRRGDAGRGAGTKRPRSESAAPAAPDAARDAADSPHPAARAAAGTVTGWTDFVRVLMQAEPRLASCIMEGLPSLDETAGRLIVAFPATKSFQMEQVQQEQARLRDRLAEFFGRPLQLAFAVGDSGEGAAHREEVRRNVAPTERETLDAACRGDAPLSALVDLLGAAPVPEAEREAWTRPDSARRGAPPSARSGGSGAPEA
jgi:DNA polymerase-3 subunit gamma/tau